MLDGWRRIWSTRPAGIRFSVGLVSGALALGISYALLAGPPKAVLPSDDLFAPVEIEKALAASRPDLSSFDFIFRPVFALNRKPPVHPGVTESAADQAATAAVSEVESIDGVSLLGIFGSGEVSGAIVRLDNGERRRITVGESVKGWKLSAVGSRRASLLAANGEEAVLQMAFANDQVPLADELVERLEQEAAAAPSPSRGMETAEDGGEVEEPAQMTFGSIYKRRREAASQRQQGNE